MESGPRSGVHAVWKLRNTVTPTLQTKLWLVTAATIVIALRFWYSMRADHGQTQRTVLPNQSGCGEAAGVKAAIENLSVNDLGKAKQAKGNLLRYAETSPECRSDIIALLIQAMSKPNLSFVRDKETYFLWLHGSGVLGSLKAVEGLDLLIDHLDVNDGMFSASLSHQPAVLGVMEMGALAVPKLDVALRHNENPDLRLAAALCLAHIGGPEALKSLEWAATSDADECVRRFANIALKVAKLERDSKASGTDADWDTEMDLRRQLLYAYRCSSQ